MGTTPSVGTAPGNRWLWVVLAVIVLAILGVAAYFFLSRSSSNNAQPSATPNVIAVVSPSPSPPPSPAPPSPPPAAPVAPVASPTEPVAAASPAATEAAVPSPTPIVIVVTATPESPPPAPAPAVTAVASPSPVSSPAPSEAQISAPGGLGNSRADFDATYSSPVGQAPNGLVVYRNNTFELHVGFVPDLNGRSALVVQIPRTSPPNVPLDQAQIQAHALLPRDAQPPNPAPEGNDQFVVERYTSQLLEQALPATAFSAGGGEPGQLLIVYQKNAQGGITRWMLGAGNDPNALIQAAGP